MASGASKPNSGLKAFTDSDYVITEEFNAIIDAIETNAANISLQNLSSQLEFYAGVPATAFLTKKAGIYILDIVMSVSIAGQSWTPLATIPAEHRPVGRAVKAVVQGSGSNFGWLEVGTDGIIYSFFHANDTQICGQAVWALPA